MPKVSIIVPVYKAEKYLRECIDSIISQTFNDWECILVDDGSPDNSGKICDEYAVNDSRLLVIHKENGGVSSARNAGLDIAEGEWITFVDSDDCLYSNALEQWIVTAESNDLDLVQCHYNRVYKAGEFCNSSTIPLSTYEYADSEDYLVCVGGNLFKSSIIMENNMRFDGTIRYGEDQLFIYNFMISCRKIQRISDVLYFYRDNNQSATSQKQKSKDLLNSIKELNEVGLRQKCFHIRIQKQIQIFIERILCNYDLSAKEYNCIFSKYYDPNFKYLKALVVYHKLYVFCPYLTYKCFGRLYSFYHRKVWK